jgi:hypothetical protein
MAEPLNELEAKLLRLGDLLRRGQARRQPLTPGERNLVRTAVRRQWAQAHGQTEPPPPPVPPPKRQRGHDHGHSH